MGTKELGQTGVWIPEVGMGTWNYHAGPEPLRRGLEAGGAFIDTAESYGTEAIIGQAIQGLRHRTFLATKVSPQNFKPSDLRNSVDSSLRRLGVETIDLLQLHAPNPAIPLQETIGTMGELVQTGKIRFIGVSNFSVSELRAAQRAAPAKHPIVSNQIRYSIVDRAIEKEMLPYCRANGITVIAYSPLAESWNRIRECDPQGSVAAMAQYTGRSPAQIAINWCLCKDNVVAIPKANSAERIIENLGAAGWRLSVEEIACLDRAIRYRQRGRVYELARAWLPRPVRHLALRLIQGVRPQLL